MSCRIIINGKCFSNSSPSFETPPRGMSEHLSIGPAMVRHLETRRRQHTLVMARPQEIYNLKLSTCISSCACDKSYKYLQNSRTIYFVPRRYTQSDCSNSQAPFNSSTNFRVASVALGRGFLGTPPSPFST